MNCEHILCTINHEGIPELNDEPHCALCGLPVDLWEHVDAWGHDDA